MNLSERLLRERLRKSSPIQLIQLREELLALIKAHSTTPLPDGFQSRRAYKDRLMQLRAVIEREMLIRFHKSVGWDFDDGKKVIKV